MPFIKLVELELRDRSWPTDLAEKMEGAISQLKSEPEAAATLGILFPSHPAPAQALPALLLGLV